MLGNILTLAVAFLATSQLAVAQPHRPGNLHKRHAELHRRHADAKVVTEQSTVATVYVDQHGNSIASDAPRTVYVTVTAQAPETKICCSAPVAPEPLVPSSSIAREPEPIPTPPAPEPEAPAPTSEAPAPEPTSEAPAPTTAAPAPEPTTAAPEPVPEPTTAAPEPVPEPSSAAPAPSAPAQNSYVSGTYPSTGRRGIVYNPYDDNRKCKEADAVAADLEKLQNFSPLRIYGLGCKEVARVIAQARKYNQQVFAGIWETTGEASEKELDDLIEQVDGNWDLVHTVSVGNEAVEFGRTTGGDIAVRANQTRERLRKEGYNGPVVIADTFVAIKANPGICDASDYIAANCHPFFAGIKAETSAQYLKDEKALIREKCPGNKEIIITEVGWPSAGSQKGDAMPGVEQQKAAIQAVTETEGDKVILFSAFDEKWKEDTPETFGVEKFWGIADLSYL